MTEHTPAQRAALDAWHEAGERAWPAFAEALRPAHKVMEQAYAGAWHAYQQALPAARAALTEARLRRDEAVAAYHDAQADLVAVRDALKDTRERAAEQLDRAVRPARFRYAAETQEAWDRYMRLSESTL